MGGTHALSLALDYPELIRRLVLVNTFGQLRPHRVNEWLYYALRFILVHTLGLEVQARKVAARIFPQPEQAELREGLLQQVLQANPQGLPGSHAFSGKIQCSGTAIRNSCSYPGNYW